MLSGIREKAIVNENGKIEISASTFRIGAEVEVIVFADEEDEMDATEYLLSTEANRKHLMESLEQAKHPENFVYINLKEYAKGSVDAESL